MKEELWAFDKVRIFSPPSKEKSTLLAVAWYAKESPWGSFVKYATLAKDTGHNVRTVRRHVKALVDRGELHIICDLLRRGRSNRFYIPIAEFTESELEQRTGISRGQLKLPLVSRDLSGFSVKYPGTICPSPRDNLSLPQGQSDPVTIPDLNVNNQDRNNFFKKMGIKLKPQRVRREAEPQRPDEPIHEETRAMIQDALDKLRVDADTLRPRGPRFTSRLGRLAEGADTDIDLD